MFRTRNRTFGRTLAVSLTKGLVVFLLCAAPFAGQALGESFLPAPSQSGPLSSEPNLGRPHAEGSPAALLEKHDCWTGEVPADMRGEFPGHVIVRYDSDIAAQYRGAKAVGDALEFVFDGADNGVVEVIGFCR